MWHSSFVILAHSVHILALCVQLVEYNTCLVLLDCTFVVSHSMHNYALCVQEGQLVWRTKDANLESRLRASYEVA